MPDLDKHVASRALVAIFCCQILSNDSEQMSIYELFRNLGVLGAADSVHIWVLFLPLHQQVPKKGWHVSRGTITSWTKDLGLLNYNKWNMNISSTINL